MKFQTKFDKTTLQENVYLFKNFCMISSASAEINTLQINMIQCFMYPTPQCCIKNLLRSISMKSTHITYFKNT